MSIKQVNRVSKTDEKALHQDLKRRYGRQVASDIIEQVLEATTDSNTPDYMPVKACSEMLELFRGEAQAKAKELREHRNQWRDHGSNIIFLEKRKLEKEFKRLYRLWWVSMKLFYPLYYRAIGDYEKKHGSYYKKQNANPIKNMAA